MLKIGILEGEGVGPEVTKAALLVIHALNQKAKDLIELSFGLGCDIGCAAISKAGSPLTSEVIDFCQSIFNDGGIILAGPGGERFVYDCRKYFRLFYKLNPVCPSPTFLAARRLRQEVVEGVDILVIRDNCAGIYQGEWGSEIAPDGVRSAMHKFQYRADQVRAVAKVACRQAEARSGKLAVVVKPNGIPAISSLWLEEVRAVAEHYTLEISELEVDYAAFALLQHPKAFDVIVTSNLFGDILSDLGGVLLGSRGLCFGASFSAEGHAIYQTNHGAAWDIAGQNTANPVGHLSALAMALDLSFRQPRFAHAIRSAIETVWSQRWRTEDLAEPGCCSIGTLEMGERIADAIRL